MSKMGSEFIRTADQRAEDNEREAERLRIENAGLRAEVKRLADTLHGAREAAARIAERDYASRMEVERLRTAIRAAAALLTEGEPEKVIRQIEDALRDSRLDAEADDAQALAKTIRDAARILAQATPATP